MTKSQQSFGRNIQTLFETGAMGELTDRQLLERFEARDNEAAELAFGVLVERHGPMVFHACRSILRDRHAAEDAFQATFLILSRKAGSLGFRGSVGPWLFGVACRVAWCARKAAFRRRTHEQKAAGLTTLSVHDSGWDDRDAVLYQELNRLPERYRMAVMMCDLEGLTQEQAVRRLGWPPGTVRSRLARGRGRLRDRLTRRGLAPAILPFGASLGRPAVPVTLAAATVEAAVKFGAIGAATGTMASAMALTEGVMTMMFMSKLKLVMAVVLASGFLAGGTAVLGRRAMGLPQAAPAQTKSQPLSVIKPPGEPNAPSQPGPERFSKLAWARINVAKELRDNAYKLFAQGETDLVSYLNAQRRFDDVVTAVNLKSDADRVRFNEVLVRDLKRLERTVNEQHAMGQVAQSQVLTMELERLDAEDALAKIKAKIAAVSGLAKARLEVAKKVRDAVYRRLTEGQVGVEEWLVWQKRYHDLANEILMLTGGDRVRLHEDNVAELKQCERVVKDLIRDRQVQESEAHIVEFYRLEAEEALARVKAENG